MDFAISAAQWVLGKALAPVMDGMLEAWAASKNLGLNMDELKMELLYAQGMLDHAKGREIHSPALKELLHKLQQLAYDSDDVLDELDYFRIQDELEGTFEAANMDARGGIQDTALHARAVVVEQVRRVVGQDSRTDVIPGDSPDQQQEQGEAKQRQRAQPEEKLSGGVRRIAYSARHTIGKHFLCCTCSPSVQADGDSGTMDTTMPAPQQESIVDAPTPPVQADGDSGTLDTTTAAPQRKREDILDSQHCSPSKLEFPRVDISRRMKAIVEELKPLCAKVSVILNLELLHSNRGIAQVIAAELRAAHLKEQDNNTLIILPKNDVKTRPKTTSDTSEPTTFHGRAVETAKIMNIITGDRSSHYDLTVIPIVGLGGMGKTTLAQHIYKKAETYFHVRMWACVSTDFSVPRLLKDILGSESLHEHSKGLMGTPEKQIEQILTSRRFLLVLDDMWDTVNNDGWDMLLAPFRKGQTKGNIVLVTTRLPSVAQIVKVKTTDSTVELEGLDQVAFRGFFWSCVFGGDNEAKEVHEELDEIGEKIMEKLKGTPLAAKTVGRILRNNLDLNHWKGVLDSKEWELQTGDSDIMPALRLSYDFLPFHLQRCFSYCALFPEDYKFTSQQLIHWWIGLGILQSGPQNRSIEDMGLVYLDDLVNHGFIKKDTISSTIIQYSIHDLLHDLGLKVASRECLSLISSNMVPAEIWPSVRHLSIIIDAVDDGKIADFKSGLRDLLGRRLKIDNLQTLMLFGKLDENFTNFLGDLIKRASGLRVVNLENMQSRMEFSTLCHLRYLRLGCKFDCRIHLPSMLSRFYHLRILDLQGSIVNEYNLLRDLSNLTKLSHFDVYYDHLHSEICNVGKLHLLQELKRFYVKKESTGFELKQLGKLNKLRELGIYHLEKLNTKEAAAEAKLIDKQWLQKLNLVWSANVPENQKDVEGLVLEGFQTPQNLQSLYICNHGSHCYPTWLGSKQHSPKALQRLHLNRVHWELFPSLGHMEMLHDVALYDMTRLKELGPGYFSRAIKSLTLIGLTGLENWVPGDRGHLLSSLEKLSISRCSPLVSGHPLVSLFIKRSSILSQLVTDDFTGVLAGPICSILSSLTRLTILSGGKEVERFTKQQDDALVLLTSLQHLKFNSLSSMLCLPAGLHRLVNLKTLEIANCSSLRSLPEHGLPSSLQELIVRSIFRKELKMACKSYTRNHPGIKLQIFELSPGGIMRLLARQNL